MVEIGRLRISKVDKEDVDSNQTITKFLDLNKNLAIEILKLVRKSTENNRTLESKYDWLKVEGDSGSTLYLQVKDLSNYK